MLVTLIEKCIRYTEKYLLLQRSQITRESLRLNSGVAHTRSFVCDCMYQVGISECICLQNYCCAYGLIYRNQAEASHQGHQGRQGCQGRQGVSSLSINLVICHWDCTYSYSFFLGSVWNQLKKKKNDLEVSEDFQRIFRCEERTPQLHMFLTVSKQTQWLICNYWFQNEHTCLHNLGFLLGNSGVLTHSTLIFRKHSELVGVTHDEVRDGGVQSMVMVQHSEPVLRRHRRTGSAASVTY